jgi:hypothetical protein
MPTTTAPPLRAIRASGIIAGKYIYSTSRKQTYLHKNMAKTGPPTKRYKAPHGVQVRAYPGGTKPPRPPPHAPESWQAQITALGKTLTPSEKEAWKHHGRKTNLPWIHAFTRENFRRHLAELPPTRMPT